MTTPEDSAAAPQSAPPRQRRSRLGFVVTLVVAVGAVALLAGYFPTVASVWLLKPWDKDGPAEAVDRFADALRANDATAAQAAATEGWEFVQEDGRITAVKQAGAMMRPPTPVDRVIPSGSAKGSSYEYDYRETRRDVVVKVVEPDGRRILFRVVPQRGTWLVSQCEG